MKFNKLYLHGFKSFVEKTTVDFPDGITAIVGPNGSGKSNIMDAVRWVFGEQNAKELRGADMEDIVFNGSQKRKPAGFAEVGLTLSDIDEAVASKYGTFSEITITRKFYKTGEREYFINNRKCRLKDIKDIFMDTGLGARSISIIEQGKVDKIINATPEELRFFLEETAGVTKFKDKKKEAERRLSQTKDNLDRVTDIIEEIVTQMQSLSGQVEQLKIYEDYQSRFKQLEKSYFCTSYYIKKEEQIKIKSELSIKRSQLEEFIGSYSEIVKEETAVNNKYIAKQEEYKELQEQRLEKATKKAQTEGSIASLETKIASSDDVKANLQESINMNEVQLTDLETKIENYEEELDAARDGFDFIKDQVDELQDVIDDIIDQKEQIKDEFEEVDSKFLSITESITEKRNELIRIESTFDYTSSSISRLESEQEALFLSYSNMLSKKDILEQERNNIEEKQEQDKEALFQAENDVQEVKEQIKSLRDVVTKEQAQVKSLENNISFYDNQIKETSSLNSDDTSFLRNYSGQLLIDIIGIEDKNRLIDIGDVFVFEDRYKNDILEKVSNIKSSLRFTFLSEIDNIKNNLSNLSFIDMYNNIYIYNGIYKKAGEEDNSIKIIKLKEMLQKAEEEYIKLETGLKVNQENLELLEEKEEESQKYLFQCRKIFEESEKLLFQKNTEYNTLVDEFDRLERRKSTITKEIELAKENFEQAKEKASALRESINNQAEEQVECDEKRKDLEQKLENINDTLDDKRQELTDLKVQQAGKEEQVNFIRREYDSANKSKKDIKNNIEVLKERLEKLLNVDEIKWQQELEELKLTLINMEKDILIVEETLQNVSKEIEGIRQQLEDLKNKAEISNNHIKETDEEVHKLDMNLAGITSVLAEASTQYMDKYGILLDEEYETYAEKEREPRKIREEMTRLENKLEDLGPINLNAVNDYKEAEERYTFLTSQRDDLEGSISDIQSFISETDDATVKMFTETFNSVKDKFVEVFHILFGNGEAELKLTDPDNMLISGVEIYIQPPGKKLQHMGLLSGGEKALTAMTLLFALFLQKPTPFCFLDEVDAPLDDANVERYVSMVKALSDKTQFILITHNHNTMSVADSLYGVSMQEYGVSSILSVTLEQVEKAGR